MILNLVLIPRLGIVGAAVATVVSYFLVWCIMVAICAAFGMAVRRSLEHSSGGFHGGQIGSRPRPAELLLDNAQAA